MAPLSEQNPNISLNFSGTGNALLPAGYLDNLISLLAETSGNGPFILTLADQTGNQKIILNEPGPFRTEHPEYMYTSFEIPPGNYTLHILTENIWNVSLVSAKTAHSATNENHTLSLTGTGSQTIHIPQISNDLIVCKGYSTNREKITVDLILNGITVRHIQTDTSGLIGLQAAYPLTSTDTASLHIISNGEWTLEITQPLPASPLPFEKISGTGNYVSPFFTFDNSGTQELAISNKGSMPITVLLYVPNSTTPTSRIIPAHTDAYHYRLIPTDTPIDSISITALIEIIAENTDNWIVERCDYRVYFKQVSPNDLPQKTIPQIQKTDLLAYPVLQRFADTRFTAAYIPASESEIQKLMKTDYTIIEFSGTYYSLSISG